jgi:hypothetical protein
MSDMTIDTAVDDHESRRSECWCCGNLQDPAQMIRLGNHPEVTLCVRCAHRVAQQASEIDDRSMSGPAVRARDALRVMRRRVMERGWHRSRTFGPLFRWLGTRLP